MAAEAVGTAASFALDVAPAADARATLGPLFEDCAVFVDRLVAARPFGSAERLFAAARSIAQAMPEADQIALIDAHPRLGAPAEMVSAFSFREQGYGSRAGRTADGEAIVAELARLNAAYESRFGFRYCVFVAGRSRADLVPGIEAALAADRRSEIRRALDAVVDIAADRWERRERA